MGEPKARFLRYMHQQLTCGGDPIWSKHGTSQAFYKQKRLHFDSEEWHSRRRNSFELTFSLEAGPPGALGLRLCNETARGRLVPDWISGFFMGIGPWAGTIKGGKQYLSLVTGTCHWYLYLSLVPVPVT